jgi:hypothetical protein
MSLPVGVPVSRLRARMRFRDLVRITEALKEKGVRLRFRG